MSQFFASNTVIAFGILCLILLSVVIIEFIKYKFIKIPFHYKKEIKRINENFDYLNEKLTIDQKEKAILLMKKELIKVQNLNKDNQSLFLNYNIESSSFENKDVFDFVQGFFECYQFVEFDGYDMNYVLLISEKTFSKAQ